MLDLARWLALEPARLSGLEDRKGSTAVGKDADFVVFDPDATTYVRASELLHRHPLTPYDGMTLRGRVVDTMLGRPARMLARK
jgi:allantoinase